MTDAELNPCARFVRGFFAFLDREGIASAVLHDWEGGFTGELNDIDYVIEDRAFPRVAELVTRYCREAGWRLCQVLRHESTAAFCVCSAVQDPSCVVALDACTVYQRNGSTFFPASELLEGRIPLPWGGNRLSPEMELKYRFIKAAAKDKPASRIGQALASYPVEVRGRCEEWLKADWQVSVEDWSEEGLGRVLRDLHVRTRRPRGFFSPRSVGRIVGRLVRPTGLLVVLGSNETVEAPRLREQFGRLYFRRVTERDKGGLGDWLRLVRSTLVISRTRGLGAGILKLLGVSWDATETVGDPEQALACFLEARCARRENLETPQPCP